jgi:hypothetical protein
METLSADTIARLAIQEVLKRKIWRDGLPAALMEAQVDVTRSDATEPATWVGRTPG